MAEGLDRRYDATRAPTGALAEVDEGLRAYMLRVYNYMTSGILLTGILALVINRSDALKQLFFVMTPAGQLGGYTMLGLVAMFAPLAFVLFGTFTLHKRSPTFVQTMFWTYAASCGISVALLLELYTGQSVARVFFVTAAAFGALSLWGYTTKKDLSGWSTFLVMGLIGALIAIVVNWFLASSMLQTIISIVLVIVAAGLTAYDTQKIKEQYYTIDSQGAATKSAVFGAFMLYLDFIIMFKNLLFLFGQRE